MYAVIVELPFTPLTNAVRRPSPDSTGSLSLWVVNVNRSSTARAVSIVHRLCAAEPPGANRAATTRRPSASMSNVVQSDAAPTSPPGRPARSNHWNRLGVSVRCTNTPFEDADQGSGLAGMPVVNRRASPSVRTAPGASRCSKIAVPCFSSTVVASTTTPDCQAFVSMRRSIPPSSVDTNSPTASGGPTSATERYIDVPGRNPASRRPGPASRMTRGADVGVTAERASTRPAASAMTSSFDNDHAAVTGVASAPTSASALVERSESRYTTS